MGRKFSESKIKRFYHKKNDYHILARPNFSMFINYSINYNISKRDLLFTIHTFSELKSLANNAKFI